MVQMKERHTSLQPWMRSCGQIIATRGGGDSVFSQGVVPGRPIMLHVFCIWATKAELSGVLKKSGVRLGEGLGGGRS